MIVFLTNMRRSLSLSLMFSFLATILDSIILAHRFVLCTMHFVCNHILFTNPTLHVFPTGLAEIIGQSSIYVEHLPPPLFWCCLLFLREWWYWFCAFFSRKTDVDCSGLWRLPGEIGQRERLLEAGGSQGAIMQNVLQTYAFEEIAGGAVIFFGWEKRFVYKEFSNFL